MEEEKINKWIDCYIQYEKRDLSTLTIRQILNNYTKRIIANGIVKEV